MFSKRIEGGECEAFLLMRFQRFLVSEEIVTVAALLVLFAMCCVVCCVVFVWGVRDVVFVLSFLRSTLR